METQTGENLRMNPMKKVLSEALLELRLKWSGRHKDLYNFADMLSDVKNILILIPNDPVLRRDAIEFSEGLYEVFPEAKIRTFYRDQLKEEDVDWFGIPNQNFLSNLQVRQFGIVIDLSPEPDKVYSYICAHCASPLRLNLCESPYDFIYNLHIRPDMNRPYKVQLAAVRNQLDGLTSNKR
jgi:hypothetical protein